MLSYQNPPCPTDGEETTEECRCGKNTICGKNRFCQKDMVLGLAGRGQCFYKPPCTDNEQNKRDGNCTCGWWKYSVQCAKEQFCYMNRGPPDASTTTAQPESTATEASLRCVDD